MKFDKNTAVCNFEWKIHNFTKENLERYTNEALDTELCFIPLGQHLTEWKLSYGFDSEGIVIDLKKKSACSNFRVKFTGWIKAKKPVSSVIYYDSYEEHATSLHKKLPIFFMELEKIFEDPDNYLNYDVLTVNLKIELFDGFFMENDDCHACRPADLKLHSEFKEYFKFGFYSDFLIVCSDGTQIRTHRFILSANSPVLKTMLQCPMKESISGVMEVNDIDGTTMNEILLFMYDSYNYYGWGQDMKAILYAAEKYQMESLKNKCIKEIIGNLNVQDVVEFFLLAEFYDLNYLMQRCVMFIKANYQALHQTEDWKRLSVDHLKIIIEYPYNEVVSCFQSFL